MIPKAIVRAGEFMLNLEAGLLAMQNHGYSDVLIEEHKYDRRTKVMRKRLRSSRPKVWFYDSTQKDGRPGVVIYGLNGWKLETSCSIMQLLWENNAVSHVLGEFVPG